MWRMWVPRKAASLPAVLGFSAAAPVIVVVGAGSALVVAIRQMPPKKLSANVKLT